MPWFDSQQSSAPTEPFLVELRAAIERWPAPEQPPRFVVAFSGGLDSTVLLAALCRLGAGPRVLAVHVDHGLQPEAAQWAQHCFDVAAALGAEFVAVKVAVERDSPAGLEAAAREARYRALEQHLAPGNVLLTAHHADDQLETVFLRMLRGSGVRGLRGIVSFGPYGAGFLGRPLLGFGRAELEAQARAWSLDWLEDPSNRSLRHDRNFLRHAVLPPLLERWPAAVANVGRLAAQMAEAEEILTAVAAEDARVIAVPSRVPRAALERLGAPRQRNLLRHLLREAGLGVPSALKIDELRSALLDSRAEAHPLVRWNGGEGRVYRRELHLLAPLPQTSTRAMPGVVTRDAAWQGPEGRVALERVQDAPGLPDSWLDAGLALRFREGGEHFRPFERRHAQPLRRWFQEVGVLPWMRDRIPLLYRGEALVAVGDLWLTADVAQAPATEPRWRVRWTDHPPVV